MSLKEAEAQVKELEKEIEQILRHKDPNLDTDSIRHELTRARDKTLKEAYANLTSYDRVYLARKTTAPMRAIISTRCLTIF